MNGLLLGNTAVRVLDTCVCSMLTVKPDGFVSPLFIELSSGVDNLT